MSQFNIDGCIMGRSLLGDVQHCAVGDQTVKPMSISGPVARLGDPIAILPDNDNGECDQLSASQNRDYPFVFLSGG